MKISVTISREELRKTLIEIARSAAPNKDWEAEILSEYRIPSEVEVVLTPPNTPPEQSLDGPFEPLSGPGWSLTE